MSKFILSYSYLVLLFLFSSKAKAQDNIKANIEVRFHSNLTSIYFQNSKAFKDRVNYGGNLRFKISLKKNIILQTGLGAATKGVIKIYTKSVYWDKASNTYITKVLNPPIEEPENGWSLNIPLGLGFPIFQNEKVSTTFFVNFIKSVNYFSSSRNKSVPYSIRDKNQILIELPFHFGKNGNISVVPNYSVSLNKIKFTNDTYRYYFYSFDIGYQF